MIEKHVSRPLPRVQLMDLNGNIGKNGMILPMHPLPDGLFWGFRAYQLSKVGLGTIESPHIYREAVFAKFIELRD